MTSIHPELQHALSNNVSALETIKAFTQHHSGLTDGHIKLPPHSELMELCDGDALFWDIWQPLFRDLDWCTDDTLKPASESFLSIHKALTKEIVSWLCGSERKSNVFLIAEAQTPTENPNETYRANAFATICYNAHRIGLLLRGAPLRPARVSSLCAALAAYHPPYRRLLAKAFIDNPDILKLATRTGFRKLIHEPWKALQISHPQYIVAPPVIVLRYWGEPGSDDEELLHSILEFALSVHASPLLWIISFNPRLKLPVHDILDPFSFPQLTRLPICYDDAHMDTELFLHHRFNIVRDKHKDMIDEHEVWPSDEQMSHLTRIFSGAFDSIDVVEQFVDWEGDGGPKPQLETFLSYMVDSPSPSDEQPYRALDHFYIQMFSVIAPHLLSAIKQILSAFYCGDPYIYYPLTAFQVACLFSIPLDTTLNLLSYVSRWAIKVSVENEVVIYAPIPFFGDFLEDAQRSGHFHTWKTEFRLLIYQASLHITSHSPNLIGCMERVGRFGPKPHVDETRQILDFAHLVFCHEPDMDCNQSSPEWTLLRRFDFRCLAHIGNLIYLDGFFPLLKKLHVWDKNHSPNIVRIEPVCLLDQQFMDKCLGLAEPLDLELEEEWYERRPGIPQYVLLGLGAGTVLLLLTTQSADTAWSPWVAYLEHLNVRDL